MIKKLLEWIYPWKCPGCGTLVPYGFCATCRQELVEIHEPCCKKCGKPLDEDWQEFCYDCQKKEQEYEQGRAVWLHKNGVKKAVYDFKYHNRRVYAEFFAKEMVRKYARLLEIWEVEEIIPIPVSRKRRRQRGYNQAALLAKELGRQTNIEVNLKSLVRIRDTQPQKKLSARERKENLSKAFMWKGKEPPKRRVLLIDDIYTTGATIDSNAIILKRAGAEEVYFLTISIGQGY